LKTQTNFFRWPSGFGFIMFIYPTILTIGIASRAERQPR